MNCKVCIVEDEPLAREILTNYIKKLPVLTLVQTCENALQAMKALNEYEVDLLLLDINLPDINGMQFIKQLKHAPEVIFTTAYPQYALESYSIQAIDYLLKPISFARFEQAIQKYLQLHKSKLAWVQPEEKESPLFVRSGGKWIGVHLNDIVWVESLKDYVRICLQNEQRLTIHATLKSMEDKLSDYPNFSRIHKSYIVNLHFVEQIESNQLTLKGKDFAIGATYKDDLVKKLATFSLHK